MKKSTVNPSGPGALFLGKEKIVEVTSSGVGMVVSCVAKVEEHLKGLSSLILSTGRGRIERFFVPSRFW